MKRDGTSTVQDLGDLAWPTTRLGEALEALARSARFPSSGTLAQRLSPPHGSLGDRDAMGRWLKAAAGHLDLEVEAVDVSYGELESLVKNGAPAVLLLPGDRSCLLLAGRRGSRAVLLAPDLGRRRIAVETLCEAIRGPHEAETGQALDGVLERAGVSPRRRSSARRILLRQLLSSGTLAAGWLLRLPPGGSFPRQLAHAGLIRRFVTLVAAHGLQYLLWLAAWWLVGRGALDGRLEAGWMWAWTLLLLTLVPLRMLVTWSQGRLAIQTGALLKRRFLDGTLRLDPDETRRHGVGESFGRVVESEAVESLALSGGFAALTSIVELPIAGAILLQGAGGGLHLFLFLLVLVATGVLARRFEGARRRWTLRRLRLTHDLVEGMVGHRTRLAQEGAENWHRDEAKSLDDYLVDCKTMDRTAVDLALIPRYWLGLGILGLAPAFALGSAGQLRLAIALGGILLVHQALRWLVEGLAALATASISWRQVAPLFEASARPRERGLPELTHAEAGGGSGPLLQIRELVYRHPTASKPVLDHCQLEIRPGDRLLLEGPSGSGKSTLASLLVGLRTPNSGLLFLGGLDRPALGQDAWRRRVVMAPQFHDNHVLTETFAFNLLMGRRWPPEPDELAQAEEICRELGLGELLDTMPGGLMQMVGETGWTLSHGERSRLFLARAMLQDSDLIVLDESFAALDPENLRQALSAVLERAPTLLVIAHP